MLIQSKYFYKVCDLKNCYLIFFYYVSNVSLVVYERSGKTDGTPDWVNSCINSVRMTRLVRPSAGPRPPAVSHSSTLYRSSCFSALSIRSVVNLVHRELDKWGAELDSNEQLQAGMLFPECQRAFGGDRYNVQASVIPLFC